MIVAIGMLRIDLITLVGEFKYICDGFLEALKVVINQPMFFKAFLAQYANKHQQTVQETWLLICLER